MGKEGEMQRVNIYINNYRFLEDEGRHIYKEAPVPFKAMGC